MYTVILLPISQTHPGFLTFWVAFFTLSRPQLASNKSYGYIWCYRFNSQRMYISSSEHFYFSWSSFDVSILITSGCCRSDGEATTGSCEVPTSTSPFSANAFSRDDFATFVMQKSRQLHDHSANGQHIHDQGEPCSSGNTAAILLELQLKSVSISILSAPQGLKLYQHHQNQIWLVIHP